MLGMAAALHDSRKLDGRPTATGAALQATIISSTMPARDVEFKGGGPSV